MANVKVIPVPGRVLVSHKDKDLHLNVARNIIQQWAGTRPDLTLISNDGQSIHTHRILFCFYSTLMKQLAMTPDMEVTVPLSGRSLIGLLDLLVKGKVERRTKDLVLEVREAATVLGINTFFLKIVEKKITEEINFGDISRDEMEIVNNSKLTGSSGEEVGPIVTYYSEDIINDDGVHTRKNFNELHEISKDIEHSLDNTKGSTDDEISFKYRDYETIHPNIQTIQGENIVEVDKPQLMVSSTTSEQVISEGPQHDILNRIETKALDIETDDNPSISTLVDNIENMESAVSDVQDIKVGAKGAKRGRPMKSSSSSESNSFKSNLKGKLNKPLKNKSKKANKFFKRKLRSSKNLEKTKKSDKLENKKETKTNEETSNNNPNDILSQKETVVSNIVQTNAGTEALQVHTLLIEKELAQEEDFGAFDQSDIDAVNEIDIGDLKENAAKNTEETSVVTSDVEVSQGTNKVIQVVEPECEKSNLIQDIKRVKVKRNLSEEFCGEEDFMNVSNKPAIPSKKKLKPTTGIEVLVTKGTSKTAFIPEVTDVSVPALSNKKNLKPDTGAGVTDTSKPSLSTKTNLKPAIEPTAIDNSIQEIDAQIADIDVKSHVNNMEDSYSLNKNLIGTNKKEENIPLPPQQRIPIEMPAKRLPPGPPGPAIPLSISTNFYKPVEPSMNGVIMKDNPMVGLGPSLEIKTRVSLPQPTLNTSNVTDKKRASFFQSLEEGNNKLSNPEPKPTDGSIEKGKRKVSLGQSPDGKKLKTEKLNTSLGDMNKEKSFKCDSCEKTFATKGVLAQHMKIHTGEKPYKCESCDYAANLKGNLKSHIQRKHGVGA